MESDTMPIRRARMSKKHPAFWDTLVRQPETLQRALSNTEVYQRLYQATNSAACEEILMMFLSVEERLAMQRPVPLGEGAPYSNPAKEPADIVREATNLIVVRAPNGLPAWHSKLTEGLVDGHAFTDNAYLAADFNAIRTDLDVDAKATTAYVLDHNGSWPHPQTTLAEMPAVLECVHTLFRHYSGRVVRAIAHRKVYALIQEKGKTNEEASTVSGEENIKALLRAQKDIDGAWFID